MGSEEKRDGLYQVTSSQRIISSCCGAFLTSLLVTPLDVVKVRLQAQSNPFFKALYCALFLSGKSFLESDSLADHICVYENGTSKTWRKRSVQFTGMVDAFVKIAQREGVRALWSGLPPALAVSVPTAVIYFTCYDQLRDAFISKIGEDNVYIPLIAGGIARLGAATIISPVEMIRTRMQFRRLTYKQLSACISSNMAKDGWLSLWKGWGPTVLRDVPFSALYWCNYEYFKKRLCKRSGKHEPTFFITFPSGAAAGSIAALLTLPFDVIKTHKQTELWEFESTHSSQPRSVPIWKVMKRIVAENGFTGLFAGIVPRLTKIAPACAIMISTYEYGKSFFRRLNKDRDIKNH
ncbi:probable mitochondrial glutathione transporter SLC25A40 isoform X2 [Hemicordylus capensis]|uniref:probable mitochondrial glutathione transporter SLC25A40 isoform X2 n=1 Tax=Hemicordylus capensis TaxID=884348 RepID=UPI0023034D63|nr:probable mitochondrial glutathione transporter SLC25A40 isoform X2 [Hemicordylus capensis]